MKKNGKLDKTPFVSICTPTFNRRPFIPIMIKCFENQTYPKDKIEWIIVDDGTDKIEDLVSHIPEVKYFKYDEKMTLGKKRNLLNEKAKGDIIIYMDDDDYYPPERVSHAVEALEKSSALIAGCSDIYLYECDIDCLIRLSDNIFALTRHEHDLSKPLIDKRYGSHDAFIFNSPLDKKILVNLHHIQNVAGSDDSVVNNLVDNGYSLYNPCFQIKIVHLHKSELRTYNQIKIANGKYFIKPTYF